MCVCSLKYYGVQLAPGATMADHSDAFRGAFVDAFPMATFGQCWPHLIRKFREGEYITKTWRHFEDAEEHLQAIHLAGSPPMKDLLIKECGLVWDKWGKQMDKFWNSNCVAPWDCWSIGDFGCKLCTPNQNVHETWHNQLKRSRIPNTFRCSTEHLFATAMPDLIKLDGALGPSVLNFDVPTIPRGIMEKALWYVEHQATHVHIKDAGDRGYVYYFLSRDNRGDVKKLTKRMVQVYEDALEGKKDSKVDLESLLDVTMSMHMVCEPDEAYGVPQCEGNPCKLDCPTCKGFKHSGICSHVLCINHILTKYDVRAQLKTIGKRTDKSSRGTQKQKALERVPQREPDSSDEEEERLLALSAQGK